MPSSPPPLDPDFRDMIGLLLKHNVDFLVIGAHALAAHGDYRYTHDIDFLVRPTADNAQRLWAALAEFGAALHELTPDYFTVPRRVAQFGVEPHRIDVTTSITGVEFQDAWDHRMTLTMEGMPIPFLSRDHLIRNKTATARPKDLVDVDTLADQDRFRANATGRAQSGGSSTSSQPH